MIRITWDPRHCRVTLRGHAQGGVYGDNAVCAAASVLACTLAEGLKTLAKKGEIGAYRAILEPGYGRIWCREGNAAARTLFATVCRGYRLLAATCPTQVSYRTVA